MASDFLGRGFFRLLAVDADDEATEGDERPATGAGRERALHAQLAKTRRASGTGAKFEFHWANARGHARMRSKRRSSDPPLSTPSEDRVIVRRNYKIPQIFQ